MDLPHYPTAHASLSAGRMTMNTRNSNFLTEIPLMQCDSCGASFPGLRVTPAICPSCGVSPFRDRRHRGGMSKTASVFALWQSEAFAAHFESMLQMGRTRPSRTFLSCPTPTFAHAPQALVVPDPRACGPWQTDAPEADDAAE